mgnify:CR=1 FL=1
MKSIMLKVDDKIKEELDLIRSEEGLGTQTATITYLIKYYFLTKRSSLDTTIALLDKALDTIDLSKLPSAEEQLKDL